MSVAVSIAPSMAPAIAGDASGGGVVRQTYQSILGSNCVALWHSEDVTAISGGADSWPDRISANAATAASAGQRPTYGADSTNFLGKSVVQPSNAGNSLMRINPTAADLVAAGGKPYLFVVGRFKNNTGATRIALRFADASVANVAFGMVQLTGPALRAELGANISGSFNDTLVHDFELYYTLAAGVRTFAIDGSAVGTSGTGITTPAAIQAFAIGNNFSGTFAVDASFALIVLCTQEPSDATKAALRSFARAEWGY